MMAKQSVKYLIFGFFMTAVIMGFKQPKPKVFVLGDSISIHYGAFLKQALKGFFVYDRKRDKIEAMEDLDNPIGANGGDSNMVLNYLRELQKDSVFKTDYLLINCGLHDIKRNAENSNTQVSLEQYSKNLMEIISKSKELRTKLIWINSTPVIDSIHNSKVGFKRYNEDVIKYNDKSIEIMKKMGIPFIDLYTFTMNYIPDGYIDHVHYNNEVRKKQAYFIAGNLVQLVKKH